MRNSFGIGAAIGATIGWLIASFVKLIVNGVKAFVAIFNENKKGRGGE